MRRLRHEHLSILLACQVLLAILVAQGVGARLDVRARVLGDAGRCLVYEHVGVGIAGLEYFAISNTCSRR